MIEPFVTREIQDINLYVEKALEDLVERRKGPAGEDQQFVMTSMNDLALLLSEALNQMMNAMQMQSAGSCKKGNPKPGKGAASMKNMRQLQQQLNEQIKKMKEGEGKKPSQSENGRNPASSEGFARMAAQQEAIRRMMEQYQQEMKEQGMGNSQELRDMMQEMEKTEAELVNKIVTQQTLERLKDIETRLLKHEKAELKREQEEQRESKEGKSFNNRNLDEFLEYNKLKNQEVELLRTVPPNLRPFYKEKVNQYFYYFDLR
jgi:vacuolar-type H+-ATPase subunit I/STV1